MNDTPAKFLKLFEMPAFPQAPEGSPRPPGTEGMHGYAAFYNGRQADIYATSLSDAKRQAVEYFRVPPKKAHMVSVMLAEKPDGSPVVHRPDW